jgi:hypothetical protein
MGNLELWLMFLAGAALTLVLLAGVLIVLCVLLVGRTPRRGWTLGVAGIGAGAAFVLCLARALELIALPPGMQFSDVAVLSVPVVCAGFLAGAGVGFLTRGRADPGAAVGRGREADYSE